MSALAIAVLVIFAIFMLRGWIQGLLRMVVSIIAIIALMAVVAVAAPHVSDYVKQNTNIYTNLEARCTEAIQNKIENSLEQSAGTAGSADGDTVENEDTSDTTSAALALPSKITGYLVGSGESLIAESGIYETIGSKVAGWIINGACYLILFLGGLIVVAIIRFAAKRANDIPVIGKINRFLGLLLGLGEGYLIICVIMLFLALVSNSDLGQTGIQAIDDSQMLTFFYEHNVILNLLPME